MLSNLTTVVEHQIFMSVMSIQSSIAINMQIEGSVSSFGCPHSSMFPIFGHGKELGYPLPCAWFLPFGDIKTKSAFYYSPWLQLRQV